MVVAGVGDGGVGAVSDVYGAVAGVVDAAAGRGEFVGEELAVFAVEAAPELGDDGWGVARDD